MKTALMIVVILLVSSVVYAECVCMCVNNKEQWVCGNSWDVPAGYCGNWCSN